MTALSTRFIGKRIARREDARFLTGHGSYVDDVRLPNTLHVAFAGDVTHGRIVSVDTGGGDAGVVAVYVASDLELVHSYLLDDSAPPSDLSGARRR
jgi:carbon-monoxide dehydrogenase large subunit